MLNLTILTLFLLQASCISQESYNNTSNDNSTLTKQLIFGIIFFIVTNAIIFLIACYRRRKYIVDQSLKRMIYYESIPKTLFQPFINESRDCFQQIELVQPFLSTNCFKPTDILTQIPCYIILSENFQYQFFSFVNCIRCLVPTTTIQIANFGKQKNRYSLISCCFSIPFYIVWPALIYVTLSKKIIWTKYFCVCGQQKQIIET